MTIEKCGCGALVEAQLIMDGGLPKQGAIVSSIWDVEHYNKDGELLSKTRDKNIVPDAALDALLDIMFKSGTQITAWYVGVFDDNHTPVAGDDYAVPGFNESTTDYDEANRPTWTGGAVASESVDNSASKATFTFNATATIYGAALFGGGTGADTKGDAAGGGTLYCSAKFAASKPVVNTDVLKVTVTLTSSDV